MQPRLVSVLKLGEARPQLHETVRGPWTGKCTSRIAVMSKWCRVAHGECKVLSCRGSKERNVRRCVRVSAAHDEEGAVSWHQTLKSEAALSVKRSKGVRAMKINIARTVRRTCALVEVVSVHAAASACEGFGQINEINETPGLQSRSGLLNCCGGIAPFRAEIFHR